MRYMGDIPKCIRRIFVMRKKVITTAVLVIALFAMSQAEPALASKNIAADTQLSIITAKEIAPQWNSTSMVSPTISISDKKISASVIIAPKKQSTASKGTLYLEKKSGRSWKPVASWPINATGTVKLAKTYTGTSGITYRTRVVVTTGADKIDKASDERTV